MLVPGWASFERAAAAADAGEIAGQRTLEEAVAILGEEAEEPERSQSPSDPSKEVGWARFPSPSQLSAMNCSLGDP